MLSPSSLSWITFPSLVSSSDGHSTRSNKSVVRILGRKWILEKWIIWITLLVASIFLDSAYGDVMCYECAWQGSIPLPSTADGVSDVCRPHNFDVGVVHKIKCANGCFKKVLYEFENDPSLPPRSGAGSGLNSTSTNRTRTIRLENMTFYHRGCQEDKKTRESCENKWFSDLVYTVECICLTDYCNGEKSGASSLSGFLTARRRTTTTATTTRAGDVDIKPKLTLLTKNLELVAFFVVALNFSVLTLF